MLHQEPHMRIAFKWRLTREALIQNHRDRIHIGGRPHGKTLGALGRNIFSRPEDKPRMGSH